jgi:hypothetical protein
MVLLILAGGLLGCLSRPQATSVLAIPPRDQVRIVVKQISDSPTRTHWQWSVIGERNWTAPEIRRGASGVEVVLDKTYPINDTQKHDGSNIWVCEMLIEKSATASTTTVKYDLHGLRGKPAQFEENLPDTPMIALTKDTLLRLPAEPILARQGGKNIVFRIAK